MKKCCEETLKNMGKWITWVRQELKKTHNKTVYMFVGIYCISLKRKDGLLKNGVLRVTFLNKYPKDRTVAVPHSLTFKKWISCLMRPGWFLWPTITLLIDIQWDSCWNLRMDKQFHPILLNGWSYWSILGFKLTHISKRGFRGISFWADTELNKTLDIIFNFIFTVNDLK